MLPLRFIRHGFMGTACVSKCSTQLCTQAAFVCYAAAFGLVFLLFSHPWHTDSDDKVNTLTAATFFSICLHDGSNSSSAPERDEGATYVVYFYTDWSAK